VARPRSIDIDDLIEKFEEFINETDDPIIQRFIENYRISKDSFYRYAKQNEELSDLTKRAINKQEAAIIENSRTGKYNTIFSIFRLKQPSFGWKDKTETEITSSNGIAIELTALTAEQRAERIEELIQKRLAEPVEVVEVD
jgi:hypothetical protein